MEGYSVLRTDILRNKSFSPKRSRRSLIPWLKLHQHAFLSLKSASMSSPILYFLTWDRPYVLHTDASIAGGRAALRQENMGAERDLAYASYR